MIYMSTLLLSLFVTVTLIPLFRLAALRLQVVDFPSQRKVHEQPTPKCGGLAMAVGTLLPMMVWLQGDRFLMGVALGAAVLVVFGVADDLRDLPYWMKFAGQAAAALVVMAFGGLEIRSLGMLLPDGVLLPAWISLPLTLVVIVGVTNAINLSDGLDGLAGGITLLSFLLIGYLAYLAEHAVIALLCCAVMGAIFGFLRFNSYPAMLFMGDAGSQLLGFLAIALSLHITQASAPLSPLLPLIILGFPVLDTLTVMAERVADGRSPFSPDKNHFHHRLLRLGLFHTEAVVVIYFVQGFLVTAGYVLRYYSEWFLLIFYLVFSALVLGGFLLADRMGWQVRRFEVVDLIIKGKLRVLKDKQIAIRSSFFGLRTGLPLLFLASCLVLETAPLYLSAGAGIIACGVLLTAWLKRSWRYWILRTGFFLTVPLIVYLGQERVSIGSDDPLRMLYNLCFGALALVSVLTLKFTRRTHGFRPSPMDFLILIIALLVPILPGPFESRHLGLIAVQIMVFFFSFEVLMGELRGEHRRLSLVTGGILLLLSLRGFLTQIQSGPF
jgi:UDP-GlcNAc:undecaprenyl-phosphate/decaprenyl-phosphate GlcNAc-1-phosphate transferase